MELARLRRTDDLDHVSRLRLHAQKYDLTVSREEIVFIDRTIVLVHGSGENLARSNDILGAIAELRLAKTTAAFFTNMSTVDQRAWVDDLLRAPRRLSTARRMCVFSIRV